MHLLVKTELSENTTWNMHPTRLDVLGFLSGFGRNISSDITLFSAKRMDGATKEYSAKTVSRSRGGCGCCGCLSEAAFAAGCCWGGGATGALAGTSIGSMLVNSSLKLETSVGEAILGMNGAGMFFLSRSSQLTVLKKT